MAPTGIRKTEDELIKLVRTFIGDTPEENRLVPDRELSDDKLRLALQLTLDNYNNTPPYENVSYLNFPSLTLIIHGAVIQSLIMAGILQSRNYLQFNDGGISEVVSDKAAVYQSWIGNIIGAYREEMANIKVSLNMERNFGVIASPYGNVFDFNES
jgi:hypothetical protein